MHREVVQSFEEVSVVAPRVAAPGPHMLSSTVNGERLAGLYRGVESHRCRERQARFGTAYCPQWGWTLPGQSWTLPQVGRSPELVKTARYKVFP